GGSSKICNISKENKDALKKSANEKVKPNNKESKQSGNEIRAYFKEKLKEIRKGDKEENSKNKFEKNVYEDYSGIASFLSKNEVQNQKKNVILKEASGDLNVTLKHDEHSEGMSCSTTDMIEFQECIGRVELEDINKTRCYFTWTKSLKNLETAIMKKLDGIIGIKAFISKFPQAQACFLPFMVSDHSLAVLIILKNLKRKNISFRFSNYLTDKEDFILEVRQNWNENVDSYKMYVLVQKLKRLKKDVKKLNEYNEAANDEEKLLYHWIKLNGCKKIYRGDKVPEQFVKCFKNFLGTVPFNVEKLPVRYLGVPLVTRRNSRFYDPNPNSFDFPPDSCHPPHLTFETYSCDSYGNDSDFGYDCQPQLSLNYESEPGYIENYNSYPYDSSSFPQQEFVVKIARSKKKSGLKKSKRLMLDIGRSPLAFAGELTLLKSIPSRIDGIDRDPEEDIHLIERLLYDNSSPRPPKEFVSENSNADIESFSPSPIPVEDSDSRMEEIDLTFTPDDPMPPRIENDDDDSERDILILEELLDNYSLSLPENESFHFDIPSFSHPPAKPPEDSCQRILSSKSSFPQLQLGIMYPNLID
nr:hypothetical protein [Tanacetum cinerariifolium]